MKYRTLGASGLQVSPICLGTMTFGSPVAEADAIRLTHEAIDLGINFIDTANVYEGYARVLGSAGGVSEEIVGKALRDRRDKVIVATKVSAPNGPGPQHRGLSAVNIQREVDRSLRRLQTDYIDLYIFHWPDKCVPLETSLRAMDIIVRQGKVRHFGASNHSDAQLCELLWLADKHILPRVVSSQIAYSMLLRHLQYELHFCEQKQIAVTPYQTLQSGLLTGKYRRGQPPPTDSRAVEKPAWIWKTTDALYDQLEGIEALANEIGVSMTHYALAWTLAQPGMTSLIVGAKRIAQFADALGALDVTIPPEHFAKIDALCPPPWKHGDFVRG